MMKKWHHFSIRTMIILVAACAPIFLIVRLVRDARSAAMRSACVSNLKCIGLALHNYHNSYDCFPPALVADASGKPMHSWRTLIVPFLESSDLYNKYNLREPWDSPSNLALANHPVGTHFFNCPSHRETPSPFTSYVALVGPGALFPGAETSKLGDVRDGTSNTIMIVEIADTDILWSEPRDLDLTRPFGSVNGSKNPRPSSMHGPQVNVLYIDGNVSSIRYNVSLETLKAMASIAGGESVNKEQP